jgi:hypothetical protein
MNEERFAMLMERYFDRELTANENAELQALLREYAEARQRFWEKAEWHALFRQWGEEESGRQAAEAERRIVPMPRAVTRTVRRTPVARVGEKKIVRFPLMRWAAGIAAAAAVVMLALVICPQRSGAVATLAHSAGAKWATATMASGARLKPGWLRLEKGAVVVEYDRGARVVLEGPAEFEIRGDNAGALRSGKLRAHVPESAHGFSVETPQFTAVDIGTEFGCDLSLAGIGELHVFAGQVDFHNGDTRSPASHLRENHAVRIEHGVATPIAARPHAFLSENELARRELAEKGDRLGAWRMASRQLDAHPATVVHLDFEKASNAAVANRAQRAPAGSDAKVVGCNPAGGRWPGKGALTFQRAEDRLEFALPGQFESLTLLAWVRVGSLHAGKNPLVMGRTSQAGDVNWYLYGDGSVGLGVLSKTNDAQARWTNFHSEPVVARQNPVSWIFVASVFDGATGDATHYFNGEPVGKRPSVIRFPLQLAVADVGNSAARESRKPGEPPPNFDGSMDELAVLATALTPEEIRRIYEDGRP